MPPRWVQSKLVKIRKAYLKKPRSGGVDTGKIAAHDIFQNRNRVNTNQGRKEESLPVLDNTWMKEIPETLFPLKKTWQGGWRTGTEEWNRVIMKSSGDFKLYMLFSGNSFHFIQENLDTRWTSVDYVGREAAMKAYYTRISWIIQEQLS